MRASACGWSATSSMATGTTPQGQSRPVVCGGWCLTTLTANAAYGPWDGRAFFERPKGSSQEYAALEGPANPLWEALYPLVCKDRGEVPLGGTTHQGRVLQELHSSEAFQLKGPKLTLRRLFSWVECMQFHSTVWHSRLAAMLALGLRLGVFQSWQQAPL